MQTLFPIFAILLAISSAAQAEVLDAARNGFTIRHVIEIAAQREDVYDAAVRVGDWWNGDHTFSGVATSLYLEPRPQGCFCESLGEGAGLVHMTVTFVNPGVMLRLSGGLGPLGLLGVDGNMTWEFAQTDGGTTVTLNYAVGGYRPEGVDGLAGPVDFVLTEQMTRLARFVETGEPAEK